MTGLFTGYVFGGEMRCLSKFGNSISEGIIFVFQLFSPCLMLFGCPRQNINHSSERLKVIYIKCFLSCIGQIKASTCPPGKPPGHLTFLKIIAQIPPYLGQNAVQMPHTGVHSGDQMPPPQGHFTGTKMTEGWRKRLQLSNKIFINITKTEKHC